MKYFWRIVLMLAPIHTTPNQLEAKASIYDPSGTLSKKAGVEPNLEVYYVSLKSYAEATRKVVKKPTKTINKDTTKSNIKETLYEKGSSSDDGKEYWASGAEGQELDRDPNYSLLVDDKNPNAHWKCQGCNYNWTCSAQTCPSSEIVL
ncbi:hypothetical protein CONCODRAFT_9769 [Conidiobolus coronatus NRRL 28638]|uniref:Uncharacterized protein n=1 Tax=Conidiobolus coronatus (strain ATCC 28846 / CBS 209.66 / NRRL 28638) TaxID=796925 RepID=A0A137NZI5_CONC2|nr:hypothetical protein CONCODRAFT_9769 [Conidiobolus coronatus NRRL 28638]|eukprot:KXN68044.1 hypothetical protein CONCODRAFT_9769 [Conidiobolus coronatus NRRL 28638]